MKRGTLVSLTTLGLSLVILACRDLTRPLDQPDSANRLLNESGRVVVSPAAMHGWSFYDDQNDTACTDSAVCRLVDGPTGQPLGTGSAFLSTPAASDGKALVLKDYAGTRFDAITELRYSTFRQSVDSGRNLAIALQVNADYDLTDQSVGYQGRLVYEPYHSAPGTVLDTTWQSWDAKAGKWWGTKASVPRNGVLVTNPCVQSTPCTWAQLLAAFPNVGIHTTYGAVVLKAGSSWPGFRGNVDALSIALGGPATTFDFELTEPASGRILPPDSVPHALFDSLGTVMASTPGIEPGPYRRDIVVVRFEPETPSFVRAALLDSISGTVVGGRVDHDGLNGSYYVRISGGTFDALVNAVTVLQRQPQVANAFWWSLFLPDIQSNRRPNDGTGWKRADWKIDPLTPDAGRQNWALEYVRAPMAWGCDSGSAATSVAVIDYRFAVPENLKAGSSWPGFIGNVDALSIGSDGATTTFDFELTEPASGPILPPDSVPHALFDSLGTVLTSIPGVEPGPYRRDIVIVRFEPETPLAARMATIDSISGRIVGGHVDDDRQNGSYYVRISGGTFEALGDAVDILLRQPQVSNAFMWSLFVPDIQSHRRPNDSTGWKRTDWKIDPRSP